MTTRVLRPRLRRRIPYFVGALAAFAFSVGAAFYNPIVGALGIVFFGFATVNAALRLFHPRSYATELRPDGFRVFDAMGRKVHDVSWIDVEHFTVFHGNGFAGPGTVLHVAWRCSPRAPARVASRGCAAARTSWASPTTARSRTRTSASSRCWS